MLQTKSEEYRIKNQFNELLKVCEKGKSKKNIEFIKKAFDFADVIIQIIHIGMGAK